MSDAARAAAFERVLHDAGMAARVTCAGSNGEIAVVHGVPPARLAPFGERARAFGFRYVTVDLAALPDAST